jgi:hypothetical protein
MGRIMKTPTLLASLAAAILVTGGGLALADLRETREVSAFHALEAHSAFEIFVELGDTPKLELVGRPEALASVLSEVEDGVLILRREAKRSSGSVKVFIVTPRLDRLETSGAVTVTARRLTGSRFAVQGSGATQLTLAGKVDALDLELSGASEVHALALEAAQVSVEASGASQVKVRATEALSVEASGATSVRYSGAPKTVKTDVSGLSAVEAI